MTIFIQLQPVCCIIVLVQVWKNVPAKDAAPFVFPLSALAERTETMELSQKDMWKNNQDEYHIGIIARSPPYKLLH